MTKLSDISWISSEQIEALRGHNIQTAEQVVALAQLTEPCAGLRKILGFSESEMERFQHRLTSLLPATSDMSPMPEPAGLLGAEPETEDFGTNVPEKPWLQQLRKHGDVPQEICLIADEEEIYDQGRRGTCVAQAYAKALEHMHRIEKRRKKRFSPQWLYYRCKQRDSIQTEAGTYMHTGRQVVEEDGCCEELSWPYNPEQTESEAQGPPPMNAERNASKNRSVGFLSVDSGNVKEVQAALAYGIKGQGVPLVCRVDIFSSSFNAVTRRDGIWVEPLPGEIVRGGHAMVVAGYKKDSEAPGGGWWYVINSWGERYAPENPTHAGCCWISFAYMQEHGHICGVPVFNRKWMRDPVESCKHSFLHRSACAFSVSYLSNFSSLLIGVVLGVVLSVGWLADGSLHVPEGSENLNVVLGEFVGDDVREQVISWAQVWEKILELLRGFG